MVGLPVCMLVKILLNKVGFLTIAGEAMELQPW
jgi:hypothetical protein